MTFSAWIAAHYEEKGPVAWLAFFLELIAAVTLFLLMLLTCADVFGRYFLDNAVDGTTELTEMGIAILVFAEMPVITWRGGHVVVDILDMDSITFMGEIEVTPNPAAMMELLHRCLILINT